MIKTLCTSEAAEELFRDENAKWTRLGAYALVQYLEELEEDCGTPMEFDRVAIRCDYSEHESLQGWAAEHFGGHALAGEQFPEEDFDEREEAIREYIRDHGQLIEFDGGIIVSQF